MSSSRDLMIDLTAGAPDEERAHRPGDTEAGDRERFGHLLRLALDLQLDAMLLALGAAASADERARLSGGGVAGDVPWRRWLTEDLQLTEDLTATALDLDTALPPSLGPVRDGGSERIGGDLLARYESLAALLDEVLDRADANGDSYDVAWLRPLRAARSRCATRMRALGGPTRGKPGRARIWAVGLPTHELGSAANDRFAGDAGHAASPIAAGQGVNYLPGELLG